MDLQGYGQHTCYNKYNSKYTLEGDYIPLPPWHKDSNPSRAFGLCLMRFHLSATEWVHLPCECIK